MITPRMSDDDEMPFGKHKGKKMKDVPAEYLDWLRDQSFVQYSWPKLYQYLKYNATIIDDELEKPF